MRRILVLTMILSMVILPALALPDYDRSQGMSNKGHLYLYEKDPSTWQPVVDGAWGKMKYDIIGPEFNYDFKGYGLEQGYEYSLIYYPYSWPETGGLLVEPQYILGEGTASKNGNIHIQNSVYTGDLPKTFDENHPDGTKIWLVLSEDVVISPPSVIITTYSNYEEFETFTIEVGESITSVYDIKLLNIVSDVTALLYINEMWFNIEVNNCVQLISPSGSKLCLNSVDTGLPSETNPTEYLFENNLIKYTDNSNTGHLYLYEKDSNWEILKKGAWGEMVYNTEGPTFDIAFNGYDLEPNTEYSLINYPYSFPETGGILLGSTILGEGTTSNDGAIYIENSVDTVSLPRFFDEYYPYGTKIWLVLSSDLKKEPSTANMTTYLDQVEYETFTLKEGESITSLYLIKLLQVDVSGTMALLEINGTMDIFGVNECVSPTTNLQVCLNSVETGLPTTTNPTEYLFEDNLITYTKK